MNPSLGDHRAGRIGGKPRKRASMGQANGAAFHVRLGHWLRRLDQHLPASARASSIAKPARGNHQGRGSLRWPCQGPTPRCPPVVGPLGDIRFALQLGDARQRSRYRACLAPSSRISCKRSWARGHGPVGRCASGVCGAIWLRYVSANLTFPRCKSSGPGCVQASGPTVLSMTWAATGDVGQARGRVGLSAESADGWVHGSRASCREVGRSRLRQGKRTARRCASVGGVLPPCLTPF